MSETVIMLVKTMCGSPAEAQTIARSLLERRLIACANVLGPAQSVFRWKGRIETETEYALIMKTQRMHMAQVRDGILRLHSYELPEVSAWPVTDGSPDYLRWVAGETALD